jgi:hypothetical protein
VKDPSKICVLLPPDLEDLSIRACVDPDVIALLASLESAAHYSSPEQIPVTQTEPEQSLEDLDDLSEPEGMMCLREFNDTEGEDDLNMPPMEPANQPAEHPQSSDALLEVLLGAGVQPNSCLGLPGPSPTRMGILVKAAVQSASRTAPVCRTASAFSDRNNLQYWLAQNRIMFARLLACLRAPASRLADNLISLLVHPHI